MDVITPQRKRGRPAKKSSQSLSNLASGDQEMSNNEVTSVTGPHFETPKVGRPRKSHTPVVETSSRSSNHGNLESVIGNDDVSLMQSMYGGTRSKGRTRKSENNKSSSEISNNDNNILDTSINNDSANFNPSRRKRLRPCRRSDIEYIDEEQDYSDNEPSPVPVRKKKNVIPKAKSSSKRTPRQRRSKGQVDDYTEDAEVMENDEIINCPRCDAEFRSLASYKSHLMATHTALWDKTCPEGKTDDESLRKILKLVGKIHCALCGKELHHWSYYKIHIEWCGRENEKMTCTLCMKSVKAMWYSVHLRGHRKKEEKLEKQGQERLNEGEAEEIEHEEEEVVGRRGSSKRKAAKRASNVFQKFVDLDGAGQDGDEEEFNIGSGEGTSGLSDDDVVRQGRTHSHRSRIRQRNKAPDPKRSLFMSRNQMRYFDDGFKQTWDFMKTHYCKDVYLSYEPKLSNWHVLDQSDVSHYLPLCQESPEFVVKVQSKKSDSSTPNTETLHLFEAKKYKASTSMFVGGPIWGLAWCPTPQSLHTTQFLAVSSQLDMAQTNRTIHSFSKGGLIQIWNMGCLSQERMPETPSMTLCLAHDFGCVWDMKWCPSGCWQAPQATNQESELIPRLGLLALACSDGTVRIYSIPQPEPLKTRKSIPNQTGSDVTTPFICKADPVITLVPSRVTEGESWHVCFSVAWQLLDGHRFIMAGYSRGLIRVFDLLSSNQLLLVSSSPHLTILPFRTFLAHTRDVVSCAWSPRTTSHFATCSKDRLIKFWNLENTSIPYHYVSQSRLTQMDWPVNFCGVFFCQDDCYCMGHGTSRYQDCGYFGKEGFMKQVLTSHTSCIWDVSFSNWVQLLVTGDNKGLLLATICPNMNKSEPNLKTSSRRLVVGCTVLKRKTPKLMQAKAALSNVAAQDVDNGELETTGQDLKILSVFSLAQSSDNGGEKSDAGRKSEIPKKQNIKYRTYSETISNMYLEYIDTELCTSKLDWANKVTNDYFGQFPLSAIYRVSVCPNPCSATWVVAGGQAGILRLHCLYDGVPPLGKQTLMNAASQFVTS